MQPENPCTEFNVREEAKLLDSPRVRVCGAILHSTRTILRISPTFASVFGLHVRMNDGNALWHEIAKMRKTPNLHGR